MNEADEKKENVEQRYKALDQKLVLPIEDESAIRMDLLLGFPYEYPDSDAEVAIDTDEFTAVCPWTGLPDTGKLVIRYVPSEQAIELKSLKYYLLSYRNVGIVQEHAANRILDDLVAAFRPKKMTVVLDYTVRGGLHTVVTASYP